MEDCWDLGYRFWATPKVTDCRPRAGTGDTEDDMCISDQEHTYGRACSTVHRLCQVQQMCAEEQTDNAGSLSQA